MFIAIVASILLGCNGSRDREEAGEEEKAGFVVCAANYPLAYFTERIASPLVTVRFPVPEDVDPAYWKPTAGDVLAMQRADLIVLNGASYESWLKNVSLPSSKLLDTTAGLKDRLIPLDTASTHSHGLEGEHEHSGTASTTWLDPTLAVEQARAIKEALAQRLPRHRDQLDAQFTSLARDLDALDGEIEQIVAGNPKRTVLFSHPVYQYLEARYGIEGRSVHWERDEMPGEPMWTDLAGLIAADKVGWMLWEGEPRPETAARLETLGVHHIVFDPCQIIPEKGDFLSTMEENIEALRAVFSSDN